jgi:HAD superfamily hydrolase (TIGR01509 family)
VKNSIRAVFFDLGGTLFSNRNIPGASMPVLVEAAERLGVDGGVAKLGSAFLRATRQVNEAYKRRPFYLHRDLFLDTARALTHELGHEASPAFLEWFYEAQRRVMTTRMVLRDDCLETLATLRSRGYLLSLVSNIDDDYLEPMLDQLALRSAFHHWTSSEEAGSCKPDPGIFHHALAKAGCRIEEVVFVGDSRVHDVQGARDLGMTCVLISEEGGTSHLDDADHAIQPDHQIGTLSELCRLLPPRPEAGSR